MRVIVIGATGHIGSYLVPRLVNEGHEVVAVSRQQHRPYQQHSAWQSVESVSLDREKLESEGKFAGAIAALKGDIIIDLICFTLDSARQLVEAVAGDIQQFLHCGTIWVYGNTAQQPTTESHPRRPLTNYGRDKAEIESWLHNQTVEAGLAATVIHPGHIVGPGWTPLNPAGHFSPQLFTDIAAGREILLPNRGLETLHHVHADDVAQAFVCAMNRPEKANGESFNAVADRALGLTEYALGLAKYYGQKARIRYIPLDEWQEHSSAEEYAATMEHLNHSPNCSNQKARELLDYQPSYSALEAVIESLAASDTTGTL
jgi:nucleoside-diphosphate-sugar epimerase